ncbi:uncharacterized protein BJ171DRAFT_186728 [Polychytrium aggregatum]|uniref:uncharacterized protein n=1 Tax=Polychytrium aggregatum TaxID=110093 RepID=UPI0022FE1DC6|nr:uncharacterized protein BJ171DRAFT_186728 [Polychytrium aggregatum]KAI9202161.1 hypothetical protein BJ171DRAFT_186728 [Polychytrium aggregatum]
MLLRSSTSRTRTQVADGSEGKKPTATAEAIDSSDKTDTTAKRPNRSKATFRAVASKVDSNRKAASVAPSASKTATKPAPATSTKLPSRPPRRDEASAIKPDLSGAKVAKRTGTKSSLSTSDKRKVISTLLPPKPRLSSSPASSAAMPSTSPPAIASASSSASAPTTRMPSAAARTARPVRTAQIAPKTPAAASKSALKPPATTIKPPLKRSSDTVMPSRPDLSSRPKPEASKAPVRRATFMASTTRSSGLSAAGTLSSKNENSTGLQRLGSTRTPSRALTAPPARGRPSTAAQLPVSGAGAFTNEQFNNESLGDILDSERAMDLDEKVLRRASVFDVGPKRTSIMPVKNTRRATAHTAATEPARRVSIYSAPVRYLSKKDPACEEPKLEKIIASYFANRDTSEPSQAASGPARPQRGYGANAPATPSLNKMPLRKAPPIKPTAAAPPSFGPGQRLGPKTPSQPLRRADIGALNNVQPSAPPAGMFRSDSDLTMSDSQQLESEIEALNEMERMLLERLGAEEFKAGGT